MKTPTRLIALFAAASIYTIGCSKHSTNTGLPGQHGNNGKLTLSRSSVKKGEPLTITASGNSSANLRWSVYPAGASTIALGKNQAVARFSRAGLYTIVAALAGNADSTTTIVNVTDSVYIPDSTGTGVPPGYDTLTAITDSILLTPIADSNRNLILRAQTLAVYDCFPWFIYGHETGTAGGKHVSIEFDQIVKGVPGGCGGIMNSATAFLFPNILPFGNGDVAFTVKVNQTQYQGTMTVTDTAVTFNWPYTTGVLISPLHITRRN